MGPCTSSQNNVKVRYLESHLVDNANDFDDEPIPPFLNPKDHINDFDWDNDIVIDVRPQKKGFL